MQGKVCPTCASLVSGSPRTLKNCGAEFSPETAPVMSAATWASGSGDAPRCCVTKAAAAKWGECRPLVDSVCNYSCGEHPFQSHPSENVKQLEQKNTLPRFKKLLKCWNCIMPLLFNSISLLQLHDKHYLIDSHQSHVYMFHVMPHNLSTFFMLHCNVYTS